MINEYKNIMLKSTSNEKAKDLGGKMAILPRMVRMLLFQLKMTKFAFI